MNGILLVDKPEGWTSHDVVAKLRGVLGERRMGHSGTLDPMATGLLIVFAGRATRAVSFSESEEKCYQARLRLGMETDTQDITGTVLRTCPQRVTRTELEAVLSRFRGEIEQVPPMYSAIKVGGQKLYEIARKGGEVARKPRSICIHELTVAGEADGDFLLNVRCSKGTYIRTLCHDIGRALGTCAHMSFLLRTQSGMFTMDGAVTPEEFLAGNAALLPCDAPLGHILRVTVSEKLERAVRNGNAIRMEGWKQKFDEGTLLRVYLGGRFAGMGVVQEGAIRFKCMLLR